MVNAASLAAERGIEWTETTIAAVARLHQPPLAALRRREPQRHDRGHHVAARAWSSAFDQDDRDRAGARTSGIFRYLDVPGQIGRVGTILGGANVNIASMAVSRSRADGGAVMAVTRRLAGPAASRPRDRGDRRLRAGLVRALDVG